MYGKIKHSDIDIARVWVNMDKFIIGSYIRADKFSSRQK